MRTPLPSPILQRITQPPGRIIRRAARVRDLNPQKKPIIRIGQIPAIHLAMQRNIMLLRQGEEFF
jgi:hypothetical protein